jgi:hypothetical protein
LKKIEGNFRGNHQIQGIFSCRQLKLKMKAPLPTGGRGFDQLKGEAFRNDSFV